MPQANVPSRLRQSVLIVAAALCTGLTVAPVAYAQLPAKEIHLPAQELGTALDSLASQTGIRLLYAPEAVKGKRASAIEGMLPVEEALNRLLVDSGLVWSGSDGAYAIRLAAAAAIPSPKELSPVTVTATRTEHRVDDVPASVSVIGQQDIATQQPQEVADLLRDVEGVDVAGWGSPVTLPTIRIRGIGGSFGGQTSQVLVDGMPLESPVAGIHQGVSVVSVQDLERVEVLRGPASALYGPSAVGGVVNLMTKRWKGAPGAEAALAVGSHQSTLATAAVGGAWDVADFRLAVSDYRTDGYVARSEEDPWGSKDLGPRDGKARQYSFSAGVRPAANQEITLAARKGDTEAAWLGGHPNYRMNNDAESVDLGYRYEAGNWGVFKLRYRQTRQTTHLLFDDEYYNGNTGSLVLASVDDRVEDAQHLDLQADLRLGAADLLTLGVSHGLGEYSTHEVDVLGGGIYDTYNKSKLTGIYVQDEHRFSDALAVVAGGRWDRYEFTDDTRDGVRVGDDASDSVFNPRVGLRYRFGEATSMYATVGTAYVPAPTFLMYRSGSRWLDNPDLKPENSTSYEVGGAYRRGPWSTHAAVFHTDYEDLIASVLVGTRYQFQNINKVSVNGIELGFDGKWGAWQPYANYTYTDSRIKENPGDPQTVDKHVQRIAPHKLNLGVTYAPDSGFYARLSGRHVGEYYFNDRNTEAARNPAHFVADAKAGWRFKAPGPLAEAEVSVAINNLFDRNYREQQYDYMDGRNVWLNLSAKF
jgi:outer membrane receptor protein involved in Fe transport